MGSFPETYHDPFNSSNLSTSCQQGKKKTNEGSVVVYVVAGPRNRLNQVILYTEGLEGLRRRQALSAV